MQQEWGGCDGGGAVAGGGRALRGVERGETGLKAQFVWRRRRLGRLRRAVVVLQQQQRVLRVLARHVQQRLLAGRAVRVVARHFVRGRHRVATWLGRSDVGHNLSAHSRMASWSIVNDSARVFFKAHLQHTCIHETERYLLFEVSLTVKISICAQLVTRNVMLNEMRACKLKKFPLKKMN